VPRSRLSRTPCVTEPERSKPRPPVVVGREAEPVPELDRGTERSKERTRSDFFSKFSSAYGSSRPVHGLPTIIERASFTFARIYPGQQ